MNHKPIGHDDHEDKKAEEEEGVRVREFLRRQVEDWDDQVKMVARFKGFSGQRCDWEGRYLFWRDLIIKMARHLHTFIIQPSRLNNVWFRQEGGLSPLCLPQVLSEMYNAGELLRFSDLVDPRTSTSSSGWLSVILRKAFYVLGFSGRAPSTLDDLSEDYYVLSTLLEERALQVVKVLSEDHWTFSCVITLTKLREICGGVEEASAVLSYLAGCGKANYLVINKKDVIEGVKISLSPRAVSEATSLDYDVLHLVSTTEKLEKQLDVIDQRCEKSKKTAVDCLKSGNRRVALRYARELKLAFQSREKCAVLLNRVEEVLRIIADAESSRKVAEAIKVGAEAMKQNKVSIEEVELCLEDLNMSIDSLKQVDEALVSLPTSAVIEDEDIEDELNMLEIEIAGGSIHAPNSRTGVGDLARAADCSELVDSLSDALSSLNLKGTTATKTASKHFSEPCTEV